MREKIKNATILEKTVKSDKAQMLKQVQHDMGWFRHSFGALAPDKNLSPFTSHFSRRAASRIIRVVAGVTSRSTSRVGFAIAHTAPYRKFGFTLAEVLITLGIIGIVAAMTMPSLIHKYQEKVRIQQYKKAISLISQAVASQYAANGVYFECYYGSGYDTLSQCSEMFNDIPKYLKVAKYCENNAFSNGCIPDYDGMDTMLKDSDNNMSDEDIQDFVHKNCVGYEKNQIKNSNPALVLSDGTIIVSYLPNWGLKFFLLDINGKKGPNKWGYDMFTAQLTRSKGGLSLGPAGCMAPAKGGLTNTQMYEKAFYGK